MIPFDQPPSKWRLNPFIFPSDTDFRFLLLMTGVIAASLFAFNSLQVDLFSTLWHQVTRECLTASREAFPRDAMAQLQYEKECREPFEKLQATWILGGLCLLIIVAIMIFWLLPRWRIWRNQLVPFTAEDDPHIAACLTDLCREAELSSAPMFLQNPINPSRGGLAFGRLGRYFVALNGGLITQFYTDPSQFRAVIRHELAHIKNSDIDKTFFSVAIALAFTTVALIPLAFSLIDDVFSGEWRLGLGLAWRACALAGLVYLILSAVLRTREVYADVRASVWDGPTGALRGILDTSSPSRSKHWPEFLSFHPSPTRRLKMLDKTHDLSRLSIWDAFSSGIIATIAFPDLNAMLGLILDTRYENLAPFGAGFLFAPLVVGVVGVGIWRYVYALRTREETLHGIGQLGVGLSLGMIAGLLMSLRSAVSPLTISTFSPIQISPLIFGVVWITTFFITQVLFLQWISTGASVWLETTTTPRSLRLTYGFSLVISGVLLAIWLGFLYSLWIFGYEGMKIISDHSGGFFPLMGRTVTSPLTLGMLSILWIYPLAAWFWQKHEVVIYGAFLEGKLSRLRLKKSWPLRPGLALIAGTVTACIGTGLMAVLRVFLHFGVPETIRLQVEWANGFRISQFVLAILLQLGVAAIVAAFVKRLGWAHGLFAAFVSGCLITIGYTGLIELGDCWSVFQLGISESCANIFAPNLVGFVLTTVVNWGALLAVPVALSSSAVASWLRHYSMGSVKASSAYS